jgi:predicted nucleotidyltransferase
MDRQTTRPGGDGARGAAAVGTAGADPVLDALRAALRELYGNRLRRAVLFGSRARGEARPDSDYDIAVFLAGPQDRWRELDRLAVLGLDILEATGAVVHAIPFAAEAWQDRSLLMHEIRREGIEL